MSDQVVQNEGSRLCLGCGLCCNGVLHTHAVIQPDEIDHVRSLGLTIRTYRNELGFHLPCPLFRENRCSIYTSKRPNICGAYQCDLLKKYLAGTVSLNQALPIIQRARELIADVIALLPTGYSFDQVRRELDEGQDAEQGLFDSAEMRKQNAMFLLAMAKLVRYSHKHFGKPNSKRAHKTSAT